MASVKQFPNGTWQYTFKKAGVLDKPIYITFDCKEEGDRYAARLDALLAKGIVPSEHRPEAKVITIDHLVSEYQKEAHPSSKDNSALRVICRHHGKMYITAITAGWVDDWISTMKRVENLAPATIRARVGALARCTDWGMRKGYVTFPDHPLRSLPNGYAQYNKLDTALAGTKRTDIERDRRLEEGEYERILATIDAGQLHRNHRNYALENVPAIRCFFVLAPESAMRMREMYTLRFEQIDLRERTIFLDKTKNGDKRQVPLSSVAYSELHTYLGGKDWEPDTLIFPWWDGRQETLVNTSDRISRLYRRIFRAAGCEGLTFHDLRHEATSRLFERTNLTETAIMKITGHKSHRMVMRYANLRGSDLVKHLW